MSGLSERFRFGVLGVGKITRTRFVPSAIQLPSVRITALGTRDPGRVREAGLQVEKSVRSLSYDELVRAGKNLVDGVYVALPNDMHEEWVIRCAEAGLHVLCEKPLASDLPAAWRCREVCRKHGVILAEAFMYRHDPRHHRVREMIRTGQIGRTGLLEATFSYFLDDLSNIRLRPERGGGALLDVGCYGIDLARFMFDGEPTGVTARSVRGAASGVDELTAVTLEFAPDRLAVVTISTRLARAHSYQLRGAVGTIAVPLAFVPAEEAPTQVVIETLEHGHWTEEFPPFNVFGCQIEHFVRAAVTGDPRLLAPAEDGVANARVLGASARALTEGRTILLGAGDE